MRHVLTILAGTVLLAAAATTAGAADVAKIGMIDVPRILQLSSAGKAAKVELQQQGQEMTTELEEKRKAIEELQAKFEREAMVMSRETRQEKERELRIQINDFKMLERDYNNALKQINTQLSNRVRRDILDIVADIGKKGGYLLIVEKGAVLYAPEKIDITDQVIETYNAVYAKRGKDKKD